MSQDTTRRPWGWAYVHSPLTASVCIGERCPADMEGLPNVKPVFVERQAGAAQAAAAPVPELVQATRALLSLIRRNAPDLSGKVVGDAEAAIQRAEATTPPAPPAATLPDGWKWMTHPSRNSGQPIPVRVFTEGGATYYQPWEENGCEYEWDKRDSLWEEITPLRPAARPQC